ncbi:MAG TPA: non-ribosomal peptide synthetase [Rhizomicrobium sp.]|nr:non-ribosomal peptide synthetase [Rhizomicrobium sp.]
MTIAAVLAGAEAGDIALAAPGRLPLTYGGLRAHLAGIAGRLHAFGIGRDDRVAIVLPDGADLASTFLAVAAHAVAAPLNPRYTANEFDFFFGDLKPKVLIVAGHTSPAIAVAQRHAIPILTLTPRDTAGLFDLEGAAGTAVATRDAAPGDHALLLHTSGTTSRPKLVPLTHRQLTASARNVAATLQLTRTDRGLHIMPLFHIHGLVAGLLAPLHAGGSIHCTGGLDIAAFGRWLEEIKPTWLTAVPTMHQAILDWARRNPDAARGAPLRLLRSCSAALPPSIAAGLEDAFGAPVLEAYAMTEAAHQMASNPLPPAPRKFGSVGRAAGPDIAILDPEGRVLPQGESGEIAIRGETVMTGYLENPDANAAAFTDGWFRTGDLGTFDAGGYLSLTGRLKEMINRGGEKIAPAEIENILLTHPAIAQAVAFAAPHASLGEEVAAAAVLRDGPRPTLDELHAFLLAQLSLAKVPRRIVFLPELPKGPTGKLRRIGLASQLGFATARPRKTPVAPRTALEETLVRIWREALNDDDIGIEDDFFDLGGNSLAAMRIANAVAAATAVELQLSEFLRSPTIAALALAITEQRLRALPADALEALLSGVERV